MSFEMGKVASLVSNFWTVKLSKAYSSTALRENGTMSSRFGEPNQGPIIHREIVKTMATASAVRL